jgi:tetratricopeptide (TPR) repeat protein
MVPTKTGRGNPLVKVDNEDYYKILDVRKNAKTEDIKQNYIKLVKLFPPETHPDEFQQIRRAYDTLRDPAKRSQYDILRKYGTELSGLIEQAGSLFAAHKWKQAAKLLNTVIDAEPQYAGAYILLAQIALEEDNQAQFEATMERAFQSAKTADDQLTVLLVKADLLDEDDQIERAYATLDEAEVQFPDQAFVVTQARITMLMNDERADEAFQLSTLLIPSPELDDPEQFGMFVQWMNTMAQADLWQYWSKVKARVRRFLRCMTDADDKAMALSVLERESMEWEQADNSRAALAFAELCLDVVPKHPALLERRRYLERMQRWDTEIDRLVSDMSIYPWVGLQAIRWYNAGSSHDGDLQQLMQGSLDREERGFFEQMVNEHEEIAAGILRLKKKYPVIYQQHQQEWEALFAEHAEGLNREARRRLR